MHFVPINLTVNSLNLSLSTNFICCEQNEPSEMTLEKRFTYFRITRSENLSHNQCGKSGCSVSKISFLVRDSESLSGKQDSHSQE